MENTVCPITIGLCVKNNGKTIRDTINSILEQTYPKELSEIIIVDGYSSDDTLKIIENSISDNTMRKRILFENEGLGYARQMVVDAAEADYIIWVDGDMVLTNEFIEEQVKLMENNAHIGIAKGKYGEGGFNNTIPAKLEDFEFVLHTLKEGKVFSTVLGTSGCIYRTSAIRGIGGFNLNIKGVGEDMDVERRIQDAGWDLYISSAIFYEKRRHTWKALWKEYFWHGKGGGTLYKINKGLINYKKFIPLIALYDETKRSIIIYKKFARAGKIVFLLPIHYLFKRIAWLSGFIYNIVI